MSRADFEAMVAETQAELRSFISGWGLTPHDVDDVAQEVLIHFYDHTEDRPAGVEPIRWLKGLARNFCHRHLRGQRQRGRLLARVAALTRAESDQPRAENDDGPLVEALPTCVERLTPRQRTILALRYDEGLAPAEIAERLGSKPGAIRVTLLRIREAIRDCLQRMAPERS